MNLLNPTHRRRMPVPPFTTYDGGRQICSPTAAGCREYRRRTLLMRTRQGNLCRWCGYWMAEDETTFDHDRRRGAGRQDDRIEVPVRVHMRRINGAVHKLCNAARGSSYHLTLEAFESAKQRQL